MSARGSLGLGETAALATALSWAACAQFFAAAGRRVGSVAVNHVRLAMAMTLLPILHVAVTGSLHPAIAWRDLALLAASGVVGLALGDASAFRALVLIGPARTTLVVTLTPAIATVLAWAFLGESLGPTALAGMALTLAGLALGVAVRWRRERRGGQGGVLPRTLVVGLLLALGGAAGQATGQVLAKPALAHVDPLSATLVRVTTAALVLWGITVAVSASRRRSPGWWSAWKDRRALGLTLLGTLTGPTCGVWLSQVATKHAPVGVAATLMALVPLFVMVQDAVILKRRPELHEVAGVALALLGVAVLVRSSGG